MAEDTIELKDSMVSTKPIQQGRPNSVDVFGTMNLTHLEQEREERGLQGYMQYDGSNKSSRKRVLYILTV